MTYKERKPQIKNSSFRDYFRPDPPLAKVGRLIDEHRMARHDIVADDAANIFQNLGMRCKGEENLMKIKIRWAPSKKTFQKQEKKQKAAMLNTTSSS